MRGYYARRRRRLRTGTVLLLLLGIAVLLVSCVAGSEGLFLGGLFGKRLSGYRAEATLALHGNEEPLAGELCSALAVLCSDNVHLSEFDTPAKAVELYRDDILNSLLRSNYSAYVGHSVLSDAVLKDYPYLSASVLIPEADFENAAARYLGASTVSNRDGNYFAYLSRSDCYTTPTQGKALAVELTPQQIEETQSTYRVQFSLSDNDGNTAAYSALFLKRSDGTAYLRSLSAC